MLTSLWHWSVCCRYNEDRSVHLSCTSDHVFNIVSVSRCIDVCIVTAVCFILYVRCSNGNSTLLLFSSIIDFVISHWPFCNLLLVHYFSNCSSKCCFSVVNVTNFSNINVLFRMIIFFFCHFKFPP